MKRPGTLRHSRAIARGSGPRPAPIDRRRKPRTASEFKRIYGSKKRVAWVKAQWCLVAFCAARECENAHVTTGGMGRKADAEFIVPLCRSHHRELHGSGAASFEAKYGVRLRSAAIRINALWRAHVGSAAA